MTILQESGERSPTRPCPLEAEPPRSKSQLGKRRYQTPAAQYPRSVSPKSDGEQLAKRFKGASLE